MLKFLRYSTYVLFFLGFVVFVAGASGLYYLVVVNPGPEIEQSYIEKILGRESQVYYRDGTTKLGVLFKDVHRQYVNYDQIPKHFISALVSSEDADFFSHYGVDLPGIARAMLANIRAGRVVQGGSTITQQTAKNIFKRRSRNYKEKLKELLYALRLEYHYSKEKIFEFYANQFFVSGNGHGLGVAAQYFFDKPPQELSLLECVYIAGSVKRPNYYNPFTRYNQAHPIQTEKRGRERMRYVLKQMLKREKITEQQYLTAVSTKLEFKRGKMSYALNAIMDLVRDGLSTPSVLKALDEHGIGNVSTSGVDIITSIDADLQRKTLYALRRHLSVLDVSLRGYKRENVQAEYEKVSFRGDNDLRDGAFIFGEITEIAPKQKKSSSDAPLLTLQFSLGLKQRKGIITAQGLQHLLHPFAQYSRGKWAKVESRDTRNLLKQIQVGDRVFASIQRINEDESVHLDLERFPKVQGGALVSRQGQFYAMAGGVANYYFNRATDARRLMGSALKPFVFTAAMQLGWNSADLLNNTRAVFPFLGQPYYPRPDHRSPYTSVSMSWAGVTSENAASVWLAYHLTDHLTPPRLRDLAKKMDMAPRNQNDGQETYLQFTKRIRDTLGIIVNRNALEQAAYDRAVRALEADFLFDDNLREYKKLQALQYGTSFGRFDKQLTKELRRKGLSSSERNELYQRRGLLRNSYLDLQKARTRLEIYRQQIGTFLYEDEGLALASSNDRLGGSLYETPSGYIFFMDSSRSRGLPEGTYELLPSTIMTRLSTRSASQRNAFWNAVQLRGIISSGTIAMVQEQMKQELASLTGKKPYSMGVLADIRDYRVLLGLRYLVALAKELGVQSTLQPVLSFPLGSNVITLAEAVRLYEAMVSGYRYLPVSARHVDWLEDEDMLEGYNGLAIIDRIQTKEGEVVYQRPQTKLRVIDKKTAASLAHILENTVSYGTGRYAKKHVRLDSDNQERKKALQKLNAPVPLLGKTGTANEFRNAAFLGFVPIITEQKEGSSFSVLDGYTVGVYTGFDSNEAMKKGSVRISGSQGALPIWSEIASGLMELEQSGDKVDLATLTSSGARLHYPVENHLFLPADAQDGGRIQAGARPERESKSPPWSSILTYGTVQSDGHVDLERRFIPYWHVKKDKPGR